MQKTIWDKYAQVLVDYSVDVQKGELVMITAQSFEAKDLVKAIYKRVLEKGAHPIVKTALGDLGEVFLKYASDEQLDYIDPIAKWNTKLSTNSSHLAHHLTQKYGTC